MKISIVSIDYYSTKPHALLHPTVNAFAQDITKVPVIRIFGSTQLGQYLILITANHVYIFIKCIPTFSLNTTIKFPNLSNLDSSFNPV